MREEVVENILTDNSKVPKHGSGVGVINVHNRIQLMFGEEYGLKVESEADEGTKLQYIYRQYHLIVKIKVKWKRKV